MRPRRRKALRQGDQGQDKLRNFKRFRDREDHGLREVRSRIRFDSWDGYFDSDVDYRQQDSDLYNGESDGAGRRYYNSVLIWNGSGIEITGARKSLTVYVLMETAIIAGTMLLTKNQNPDLNFDGL